MKKQNRKAFTIVELVIVIAVIGILAAVLIPTFSGIIESANKAVDTQLVAQINTTLAREDVLGGGVNDAVEIQKIVKESGLKLQTKSKGQYIWYDIEKKQAVLGGLDENGIVLADAPVEANEPTASAEANGAVLLSSTDDEIPVITEIPKGQFKAAISPENFVEGYLFLSEESADGLAEAIHALRDPEGDTKQEVEESLTDALGDLAKFAEKGKINGSEQVASIMSDFMNKTAIMTEQGTVYVGTLGTNAVVKVLVSSGMKTITADALSNLSSNFPQLYIVDLHSDVVEIDDVNGVITAGKIEDGKVNGIYFVYCNAEIEAIDYKDGGDIANLISVEQRSQVITKLQVVKVYLNKDLSGPSGKANVIIESVEYKNGDDYKEGHYKHVVAYTFTDLGIENNADSVYEFEAYSFYPSVNAEHIDIGTTNYIIGEDEQMLIKNGLLTVYAYYQELNADFKIDNTCYTSAQVTSMLADPNVTQDTLGGNTITVISTTAKLGSETETNLTIPSGVELLVPTKGYSTKKETTKDKDGNIVETGAILLDSCTNTYNKFLHENAETLIKRGSYTAINKDTEVGETNLTIANGVTLNVASGASLYVDAVLYHCNTSRQNFIDGKCGVLVVEDGAKITSSGDITAYGIIRGNGEIVANGGTVKEPMTIYDWYGGSNAAVSVGTKLDNENWWDNIVDSIIDSAVEAIKDMDLSGKYVCPFNEWKVDNLRVKTTLYSDCEYFAVVGLHVSKPIIVKDFALASGSANSNPLFVIVDPTPSQSNPNPTPSSIVKTVQSDGDTKLSLNGTVNDTNKTLTIDNVVTGISVTIDFTKIPMPVSHLDIQVAEGSTLTISNNLYKVLPGSDIIVDGTLNIGGNANVVMWNTNDVKFVETWSTVESDKDYGITKTTETETKKIFTLNLVDGKIKSITTTTATRTRTKGHFSSSWSAWSGWSESSTTTPEIAEAKNYISVIHKFSESTPAKLIVNGTLNFAGSAKFAGEIYGTEGAIITAASTVEGCSFPMGWFIQNATIGNNWYDTYNDGLHGATVMVGINNSAATLSAGTYEYGPMKQGNVTLDGWHVPEADDAENTQN